MQPFAQCEAVFRHPFPERYFQIDTLFSDADHDAGLIPRIEACQAEASAHKDQRTRLFLELHRFLVYQNTGVTYTTLARMADSLLVEAVVLADPILVLSIRIRRAWLNMNNSRYTPAFSDYLRIYETLRDMDPGVFKAKNYHLYTIALAFYQFNDYQKAIEIGKAIDLSRMEPWEHTLLTNLLGMCWLREKEHDSARHWFSVARQGLDGQHTLPEVWHGILDGNIGTTWYHQEEYDTAIPLLHSGVEKTTAAEIWDNAAGFNCTLAAIHLARGDMQAAASCLQQARTSAYKAGDDQSLFRLYSVFSQYYRETDNPGHALLSLDSAQIYQARIATDTDYRLKVQAEYTYTHDKFSAEAARLKKETAHQKRIRNYIIGIVFLLLLVALLLYNRQRLRHINRTQQLELQRHKAEEELSQARIQLDAFTRSLREKNVMMEAFSEEIERLHMRHQLTPEHTETLDRLRQSAILTDAHWEEFRVQFEKVHGGFLHRLKMKLPDLSPAETRFMALAKLQLNNKEMGSILGINPDSVRMMRHRLRKKLSLTEEGSLEELIGSV